MKSNMLTKVQKVVTEPIYVVSEGELPGVHFVDKLILKDKKWMRRRYIINPGNNCNCLGFMKVGSCKHLKMLSGDCEGTGINAELCCVQLEMWQSVFDGADFLKIDPATLPHTVRQVAFNVPEPQGRYKSMIFTQKFPSGNVVFVFNFGKKEAS